MYLGEVCNKEVFQISFLQFVWEAKYKVLCAQLVEWACNIIYCVNRKHTALGHSFFPMWHFHPRFRMLLVFFGIGFEVLRVVGIHIAVWVRTPCSLVDGYECFGRAFWAYLQRRQKIKAVCWPKYRYPPVRLHGPITQNTIILNLNIHNFPCILLWLYLIHTN
jgi:hypothetical protein